MKMGKEMIYSEVKNELNLNVDKLLEDEGFAYLTHYWQNQEEGVSSYYESFANHYFEQEIFSRVEEPLQTYLPFKYDIPFPPTVNPMFKFVDLFAGIGGIRIAFQNVGGKCVFSSEWDKFAKKTYEANFGEIPFGDITKISANEIPDHDILLAGFPCQPFSIAGVSKKKSLGKEHGFLDQTQGTLFFDVARIIEYKKPNAFLLENVKNLLSHDKGNTFKIIKSTLEELGYSLHYEVLNGSHFVPQNRERILIVGFRKKIYQEKENFKFPVLPKRKIVFRDILSDDVHEKYTLSDKLWGYLQAYKEKHRERGNGFGFGMTDLNGISRTLSARYYKDGSEILIPQKNQNPRRLTPRECARLQGFPDKFVIPVSDNQSYKQFGNSVTVPLIQFVAKEVVKSVLQDNE